MLIALARSLSKIGARCVIAVFEDSRCAHVEVADEARRQGLEVELVPCNGRWDCRVVGRICGVLERHHAAVLHTHGYKADAYGFAASRLFPTALVSTCHNWPSPVPIMRAYAALDRLLLRGFDKVAAASDPVAGVLRRSGIRGAVAVPNGVELERFSSATTTGCDGLPRGCDRLVGFVGRLVPEKGGEPLLHAARKVLAARPRTGFIFAGDGPSRSDWTALAGELGISANVVFAGVCKDMPGLYAALDLVVLPSLVEAMPMCLLEALAAGRPVIATRVGSVPKVVLPGLTGLLLEPGDVLGLAGAILRLLGDPNLARLLAEQGRAHVAQHFSAERMAAVYFGMYQQALRDRPHHREWQWSNS